jgi:hypothetical protein
MLLPSRIRSHIGGGVGAEWTAALGSRASQAGAGAWWSLWREAVARGCGTNASRSRFVVSRCQRRRSSRAGSWRTAHLGPLRGDQARRKRGHCAAHMPKSLCDSLATNEKSALSAAGFRFGPTVSGEAPSTPTSACAVSALCRCASRQCASPQRWRKVLRPAAGPRAEDCR